MSTEEHDFTIRVETSELQYDGEIYASATLTFTSDGKTVKLDYDAGDHSLSNIIPTMLKDIEACIDDPYEWISNAIKQGPESIEQLREYEQKVLETEMNIKSHQNMVEIESGYLDGYRKKVDELKERMKQ